MRTHSAAALWLPLALLLGLLGVLVWWGWQPLAARMPFLFVNRALAVPVAMPVSERAAGVAVQALVRDLKLPWDLAFLSPEEILVTEKAGRLWRVELPGGQRHEVLGLPPVRVHGQGGLMAVVLHPRFAENHWVYLSYCGDDGAGGFATHFWRARLEGDRLAAPQLLLRAQAGGGKGQHFGGTMVFDRDGYLFVSVGERGERDLAQDLSVHNGKILRLRDDGSVPPDNPFVNRPGARPEIWSYGHRNPQGLSLDPLTGDIWEAEHGPQGGDEINRIVRGGNYGWPVITYGREYVSGLKIGEGTQRADVQPPVHYYVPSIATSGMAFYAADLFPQWKGSIFVAALRGHLNRVQIRDGRFVAEERLLGDLGLRMRSVRVAPDGALWVVTDNGAILRLTPAA